jgi:spermidine synthase
MVLALFVIGFLSILGQVVLLRELNVAFYGSELIYTLALGFWLLWTATGAATGRRRFVPRAVGVRFLLLLFSVLLPLAVAFIRGTHRVFSGVPGAYLPFLQQILALALGLLPIGVLLGLLFQWAAKLYVSETRTLPLAYAIESVGGVFGGLVATLALKWGMQNLLLALSCSFLAAVAVLPIGRRNLALSLLSVIWAVILLLGMGRSHDLDVRLTSWNHPDLVATRDTPYSRVTVTSRLGQTVLFSNNELAYETQETGAEEFVHLSTLQHADPSRILILGGGAGGLVREALKHHPEEIIYVELDRSFLDLVLPILPHEDRVSLETGNVRIVVSDPRRFLREEEHYDVILVGMPEPTSGQSNRFYSREFFAQCSSRLEGGGLLALRLRSAENLWTPQRTRRTASIHNALRAHFRDVLILPGVTNIVLATNQDLVRDPRILAERLDQRGVEASLVTGDYVDYVMTNDRLPEIQGLMNENPDVLNTDARPICYQYTQMLWLSQFFPGMSDWDPSTIHQWARRQPLLPWVLWLIPIAVFLLLRRIRQLRRILLVAVAGFLGMVLESILILQYQSQRGILFQDIGILLTLFMGGLALGSLLIHRLMAPGRSPAPARTLGLVLMLLFAGLGAVMAWQIGEGGLSSLGSSGLALLLAGGLVAAVFAFASLHGVSDQRSIISPLYAADLVGGCVGSLAASLVLLPLLGLGVSAWGMAILAVVAIALIA